MESSRKYTSVTSRSATAVTKRYAGGLNGNRDSLGSLFGNLTGTGGEDQTGQTEGKEENDTNLEDISTHFKNLSGPVKVKEKETPEDALFKFRQQCIQLLLEIFFQFRGEKYDQGIRGASDQSGSGGSGQPVYTVSTYTSKRYHREEEHTTFSTTGTVKTKDGRELSFNLEVGMSRRFEEYCEETFTHTAVTYCDPLVINLDTDMAKVSDQKFFFDLDQDGTEEEISTLKSGSGFLALDLNGDGVINDGSELFGAKSGDGFKDLAKYDSDGNGWIDEADEIWKKLLVWIKDDEGNDKLYHLSDLGVGAIGLGNVSTQFALNSETDNRANAMIRKTGVFLYESGTVSTVQHLDMARIDSRT